MNVSSVDNKNHSAAKTGRKLGTVAGFVGYPLNVLKKEGKDTFKSAAQEAAKQGLNPKAGIAVKAGSIALIALGAAGAGRIIGGLIGKAIDKITAKKADK